MRFIIKGKAILDLSGASNVHRFALRARVSTPTAYKYISNSSEVKAVDGEVLASLLIDGVGLTPEQALDLRLGDLFEFEA